MATVLHLIDDTNLGGVNRALESLLLRLEGPDHHEARRVRSVGGLPGRVTADIVVVHFTVSWAKLPFLLALRLNRAARLVLVEHTYTAAFERHCVPHPRRFRAMLRGCYGLFDRVVAVSDGQANWLRDAGLVAPERVIAILQALDLGVLEDLPPPAPRSGPLRLGAYGRYVPQKGFDILIEAMRHVSPEVASLRIAGFGPDAAALKAAAVGLHHVHVADAVTEPSRFLAELDAVVVPSRWEAFGLVALESRAAGRAVIAAKVDGLVEQIAPETGILVDPGDAAALAGAIERLAAADCASLGAAARRSARGALERNIAAWRILLLALAPGDAMRQSA
jgi:glycosyltransferase involved in cell wall biosynthesis